MDNSNSNTYFGMSPQLKACLTHLTEALKELKHRQYLVITYPGDEEGTLIFNSARAPSRGKFTGIDEYEAHLFYIECIVKEPSIIINKFRTSPVAFELIYKRK